MGRGHALSSSVPIIQPQTYMGNRVMVHDHIPLPHPPACCKLIHLSCLTLCNPWTFACQAPLSMGFSRQEYWSGLSCPPPGESSRPRDPTKISYISCIGGGGSLVAKSCLTLTTLWTVAPQAPLSMGFFQARILEWIALSFSRGFSQPRNRTQVSCTAGRFFTDCAKSDGRWYHWCHVGSPSLVLQ